MKITNSIEFRIEIEFPDANVDVVYNEMRTRGVSTVVPSLLADSGKEKVKEDFDKLDKTPTESSVDFVLNWLAGFVDRDAMCIDSSKSDTETELEKLGLEVESWDGLMMGTCHLILSCPMDKFNTQLVAKANSIVEDVFTKLISYHKDPA